MNEPGEAGLSGPSDGVPASFSNWEAKDWAELRRIWRGLVPEYHGYPRNLEPIRRFRKTVIDQSQAGHVFERWVMEAFQLAGHETEAGWSVRGPGNSSPREQIDGLVLDGWQAFLVESKFWKENVDYAPIAILSLRVGHRPPGCMGMFFSAFGFTGPSLETARLHQPLRVLLFNGYNLREGVQSAKSWRIMVKRTWVRAVKYCEPLYVPSPDDKE